MPLILKDPIAARIVAFLESIQLPVRLGEIEGPSFLPGISIQAGGLLIDEAKLLYPGDLLHEAGHLAMLPVAQRRSADGDTGDSGGIEMSAIAWSYAALVHLGLDPAVVFHQAGYRGASESLIRDFAAGNGFGVPLMEWAGLTATSVRAEALGVPPYPHMRKWLRDDEQVETEFVSVDQAGLPRAVELSDALYRLDGGVVHDEGRVRAMAELIAHPEFGGAWLIRSGGNVAGYVALTVCYSLEFHGKFGLLDELYVEEGWRGKGIGASALAFIDAECRQRGLQAVRLEVSHANIGALELYRRSGYRVEERHLMSKWL
jgi:ribosomal protein S18 acetylase RimI-like enzyme